MGKRGPKIGHVFRPEAERFWEKVDKHGPIIVAALGPCWPWLGHINNGGYGKFGRPRANRKKHWKMWNAMSVACELSGVPIPDGLVPDHLCRNRSCVNPNHAEAVTQKVNTLRGESYAARNARKTQCPAGHPLTGSTLYVEPSTGRRRCLTCKHATEKRCRDRRRQ
jgi:hypothetical protein